MFNVDRRIYARYTSRDKSRPQVASNADDGQGSDDTRKNPPKLLDMSNLDLISQKTIGS